MAALSVRNRTSEFQSILESARATRPVASGESTKRQRTKSDFAKLAAVIGRDVRNTSIRLEKLTNLAQRRTLFDDPTAEIQELTMVVKQDIAMLNGKVEELSQLRQSYGSKQVADHTTNVVNQLKTHLMTTTQDFQEVLKTRTDSLQAQQNRRSQFLGATPTATSAPRRPPMPTGGGVAAPLRPAPPQPVKAGSDSVSIDLGSGSLGAGATQGGYREGRSSALSLSMMEARPEQGYQQARADAVRQVESTIVELGQIFNQLATMVAEQGEMVERIDANVEDTQLNVNAGHLQLMKYYNGLSSNRSLILKVFATVFIFLFIWVLIA